MPYSDPIFFMEKALRLAKRAYAKGEAPIGAIVVQDGIVISRGWNTRETKQDALGHAEIMAIRKACKKLNSWRLEGCEMYVTLEPCYMCAGAIQQARIKNLYFGTPDPKGGAVISKDRFFEKEGLNHSVIHEHGFLQEACSDLLKQFFLELRQGLIKTQKNTRPK